MKIDRTRLYHALESHEPDDQLGSIISITLVGLIGINLIAIILESIPSYAAAYGDIFTIVEYVSCSHFCPRVHCSNLGMCRGSDQVATCANYSNALISVGEATAPCHAAYGNYRPISLSAINLSAAIFLG